MLAFSEIKKRLIGLFEQWASEPALQFQIINPAGSERQYFRIRSIHKNAIGVFHTNGNENEAFLSFSKTLQALKINVPEIYATKLEQNIYLLEDLGDQSLFSLIQNDNHRPTENTLMLMKKSLEDLAIMQTQAVQKIDFSKCYPSSKFDKQSLLWDLNYFKYYFLKPQNIDFNELKLEEDFNTLANYLLQSDQQYFVFRDFQSRNILIHQGEPYYIDYQGGRMGPLQYDLASFLFQVKARLSNELREDLLNYYLQIIGNIHGIDIKNFKKYYYPYVLIRICQVLGAYGFRGIIERKAHFIQSIPYAVSALAWLINNIDFGLEIPELKNALHQVAKLEYKIPESEPGKLSVHLNSFAYKSGIPRDYSGHGEGFVFDCRSLPNPYRIEELKHFTGLDEPIINYLKKQAAVSQFSEQVIHIIEAAISEFKARHFSDLSINFGCTGGQHRSVYMAELVYQTLKNDTDLNIHLKHTQKNNWITV